MKVHHHLDDATLVQFAGGKLDEAFATIVASHIAMCGVCAKAARIAEEVGGSLLENEQTAEMSAGSFELLMGRLDDGKAPQEPKAALPAMTANADVPRPLARHIGPRLEDIRWKRVAPGVRKHDILREPSSGSSLYLLHIAPGTTVPEHGHGGAELTLILSGMYADSFGAFRRGDIADLDEHVEHQPRVEGDEPCICLVAAEAPTRFKGILGRLMQPFVGI